MTAVARDLKVGFIGLGNMGGPMTRNLVERIGARAHDSVIPQFISSPGYEHAWLNPDNTEVSFEDLLSAPAIKLLIRQAGASSAEMAARCRTS